MLKYILQVGTSEEKKRNMLTKHSFFSPFSANDLKNGWNLQFSATSTSDYLVLIPSVYNRRGLLYHSKPILSNNMQVEFKFHIHNEIKKEAINEKYYKDSDVTEAIYKTDTPEKKKTNGFALWFLEKEFNVSKLSDDNKEFEESEFLFYGYKKDFHGIGIFFQLLKGELIVSALSNNGNVKASLNNAYSKSHNFNMLNHNDMITVRINTGPNGMSVHFYDYKKSLYIQSLTVSKKIPRKNYIGLSAFNFNENKNIAVNDRNKYVPTFVGIKNLTIYNNDKIEDDEQAKINTNNDENTRDSVKTDSPLSANDLSSSVESILKDIRISSSNDSDSNIDLQTTQAEILKNLVKLLQRFIILQSNNDQKLLQHINLVQQKLNNMQIEIKDFKKYFASKTEEPQNLQKMFTTELSGLKSLFQSHTQHNKKNIEDISNRLSKKLDDNEDLKKLAQKAEKLESIINQGNSATYLFYLAFTALVITTFLLVYKKIKDVEKKHIL